MLGAMGSMVHNASLAQLSARDMQHSTHNNTTPNVSTSNVQTDVDLTSPSLPGIGLQSRLQLVAVEHEPSLAFVWGAHTVDLSGILLNTIPAASAALRSVMQNDVQLARVRSVLMNRNSLSAIPARALRPFWAITYLDLSFNNITTLPADLVHMSRLVTLDLHCNKITELPSVLVGMSSLANLYLQHNQLTSVPSLLLSSPVLEELRLEGNPLPSPLNSLYAAWTSTRVDLSKMGLRNLPRDVFLLPRVSDRSVFLFIFLLCSLMADIHLSFLLGFFFFSVFSSSAFSLSFKLITNMLSLANAGDGVASE